jgi:hypothetical protein
VLKTYILKLGDRGPSRMLNLFYKIESNMAPHTYLTVCQLLLLKMMINVLRGGRLFENAIHVFLECPRHQHDRTSLFNCLKNIVPISIEYILVGYNELVKN